MPKATFYNLKDEKKEMIEKAAVTEFSKYGYFHANISRIAKQSKISVGSFYQYFDDINDLFMHIFKKIADRKIQYIKEELEKATTDSFEENLKAIYTGGIRFALHEPNCFNVANTFRSVMKTPVFEKLMKYYTISENNSWLLKIYESAVKKGEISKEIPYELFVSLFTNLHTGVMEYMGVLDCKENFTEENMKKLAEMSVHILLNGIK